MITGQKQLIISYHDLHPGSWKSCQRFINRCKEMGADKWSLLVIPQYHGAPAFTEDSEFTAWLKSLPPENFDLCLHGYFHKAEAVRGGWFQQMKGNVYTTGEGEFYQLNQEQAASKLRDGLGLFESSGLEVHGFTAPAWLVSKEAREAISEYGFQYNTLWDGVELPASRIFVKAPTLVYSSRNAWRRFVSRIWINLFHAVKRNSHFLRLAVHPIDFEYPAIENHLYRVLEKALRDRTCCTYRDLIPENERRPVRLKSA
ncbi:MAG: polysaccharide deacetylase family protein [Verrucomicrobiae bacterium]|nr:polysaccharide deacetylase family protein [Verrucomicrobiae bacterium]